MAAHVLVVDDERSMREFLQILLERQKYQVKTAGNLSKALSICQQGWPDLLFVDLKLPDGTGLDILQWIHDHDPDIQVIIITAYATAQNAVQAMRMGAYDYQIKPFKVEEIQILAQKALEKRNLLLENRQLKVQLRERSGLTRIVGRSPCMLSIIALIEKVASTKANVLIEGESGTGKEVVARAIHDSSIRSKQSFVAVNCGAIPENLIESELFGHRAGAFTGAYKDRPGLFRTAHGGTLLLDEISELPRSMQVKLLRAIEEKCVRRVGEEKEVPIDVRILASTNRDLQDLVKKNRFREDLYYRLNVVKLKIPNLRERVEDIPLLARSFMFKYAQELDKNIEKISPDVMRVLTRYSFPGNVRELENCIERAVMMATGDTICLEDLPEEFKAGSALGIENLLAFPDQGIELENSLERIESKFIQTALKKSGGVKKQAAKLLGLSFRSLRYRLQKMGLDAPDDERDT